MRFTHATLLHEPQKSGLAFRYMSKLTRSTITLTSFSTIPMGVPKNPTQMCGIFPFHGELCVSRMQLCCTNPRNLGWRSPLEGKLSRLTITFTSFSTIPMGVPQNKSKSDLFLFYPYGEWHTPCAQLCCTNPITSGLAFRYMSKLTRSTITFNSFTTIPMGVSLRKT